MALLNYTTSIAASKTIGEMQDALAKAGANSIAVHYSDGSPTGLTFSLRTKYGPQLFTLPRDCPTYDGGLCDGTCWIAYHQHQPYAHAPGPQPLPPCTCRYGLWYVPGAPGPYSLVDVPGVGKRGHTLAFKISPFCVHHGQGVWFGEAFGEEADR